MKNEYLGRITHISEIIQEETQYRRFTSKTFVQFFWRTTWQNNKEEYSGTYNQDTCATKLFFFCFVTSFPRKAANEFNIHLYCTFGTPGDTSSPGASRSEKNMLVLYKYRLFWENIYDFQFFKF